MSRRCSLCSSRGHSKRTCSSRKSEEGGIIKLFGVRLTDTSFVKKSSSLGNLSHYTSTSAAASEGYHSDDPSHGFVRRQAHRKKGIPWTEEEHRQFLVGLQKLGKGDWKGISRNYVPTKTPTQVASHAQKYFIRQSEATRKKRRSLFDMVTDMEENVNASSTPDNDKLVNSPSQESNIINPKPSLDLSLKPVYMPLPFQLWPPTSPFSKDDNAETSSSHQIPNESGKEFVGIAQLNLNETTTALVEPPTLSLMLPGDL